MCDSKLVEHTDSWASGWWVSDRSAPGASTMEAPHQSLFQKGAKTRTAAGALAFTHPCELSLCTKELQAPSPSNPVPTCPHPVLTGHRSCAFLHVCNGCQPALPTPAGESGASRSVLAAFEGDFFSSLEERAGARHPVGGGPGQCTSLGRGIRSVRVVSSVAIYLRRQSSLRTGGARQATRSRLASLLWLA